MTAEPACAFGEDQLLMHSGSTVGVGSSNRGMLIKVWASLGLVKSERTSRHVEAIVEWQNYSKTTCANTGGV